MFSRCSAEVDCKTASVLLSQPTILRDLKQEIGVDVAKNNSIYILLGSLVQVEAAHEFLADALRQHESELSNNFYLASKERTSGRDRMGMYDSGEQFRSLPNLSGGKNDDKSYLKFGTDRGYKQESQLNQLGSSKPNNLLSKYEATKYQRNETEDRRKSLYQEEKKTRMFSCDWATLKYIEKYQLDHVKYIETSYIVLCVISAVKLTDNVSLIDAGDNTHLKTADQRLVKAEQHFLKVCDSIKSQRVPYDKKRIQKKQVKDIKEQLENNFKACVRIDNDDALIITGQQRDIVGVTEFAIQAIGGITHFQKTAASSSHQSLDHPAFGNVPGLHADLLLNQGNRPIMSLSMVSPTAAQLTSPWNTEPLPGYACPPVITSSNSYTKLHTSPSSSNSSDRFSAALNSGATPNAFANVTYLSDTFSSMHSQTGISQDFKSTTHSPDTLPSSSAIQSSNLQEKSHSATINLEQKLINKIQLNKNVQIHFIRANIFDIPADILVCSRRCTMSRTSNPCFMEEDVFVHGGQELEQNLAKEMENNNCQLDQVVREK